MPTAEPVVTAGRRPDWEVRLARWATLRNGEPFVWGRTDCAMLCFEALEAITGADVCSRYLGQWHSRSSALRYQQRQGTTVTRELLGLGCSEITPGYQQRGDFVIIERAPFPHAHVCFGEKALSSTIKGTVCWSRLNFGEPEGMRVLRSGGG